MSGRRSARAMDLLTGLGSQDGHWFFGKMLQLMQSPGPNDIFLDMMQQWPNADLIRYLSLGNEEILFVNSLQALKETQQTYAYAFEKSPIMVRMFQRISGKGLLFATGDEHKHQRIQMNSKSCWSISTCSGHF